jgi:AcrR family transcriptional regulator
MAAAIIVESGVSGVTMEAVAARSDVDKRLGYRYFANRDDLIVALVEREFDAMRVRVHAELPAVTSFDERVRVNARLWLATIVERGPLLRRLLYGDVALEHYASTVRNAAVANWGSMVAGETALEPASAAVVTRMLLAALSGAVDAIQIEGKPLDEVADFYSTIVLAGIHALKQPQTSNEGKNNRRRRK